MAQTIVHTRAVASMPGAAQPHARLYTIGRRAGLPLDALRRFAATLLVMALTALTLAGCVGHAASQNVHSAAVQPKGAVPTSADILISGGTIFDGSENPPFTGDVAISGERITYIGPPVADAHAINAKSRIDARGKIVAPGFIDPHTHADALLGSDDPGERSNTPWLTQGVTTVMIGVDGFGRYDMPQRARAMAANGIGTNIVPFVGLGGVQSAVLKGADRAPNGNEIIAMQALVEDAMCDGALGLSTGLFYTPQNYVSTKDVIQLAKAAGERGGIYDTHLRDESTYTIGLEGSVAETIAIGRAANIPVHIAHIKALGVDVHGKSAAVIAQIEAARRQGVDVTADQYPWLASGTALEAALLPKEALAGGNAALLARLADPQQRAAITPIMAENLRRRGGADSLLLTTNNVPWSGKTLAQMSKVWAVSPVDAAIRIIRESRARPDGLGTAVASFNMAESDIDAFMRQPWVVTSSDGSTGHPRMYASYPKKYQKYVRELAVMSLGQFIRQSTGKVADIYGLEQRGYLRPGFYADVLVFDPESYAPRASYLAPRELSSGVTALFVNGKQAVSKSAVTGELAGKALLRTPPKKLCTNNE